MSRNLRTKAIILRRTNYGEADRILQILTPNDGKLSVMARSVRKEKSRLANGIELFSTCDLSLVKSERNSNDIWTLTGSKVNKFFVHIMENYDKLQFGYEAIKLVDKAAEHINEPDFFNLLTETFAALDNENILLNIAQTWFYLQLAKLLGNELNVATDNHGMKLVEGARYDFDMNDQVFSFNENGKYDSETIKLLRVMTSNSPDVISRINNVNEIIGDCLHLAQIAAKV